MKPPKGYRIYLSGMGHNTHSLLIRKNGRVIYAPTELYGSRDQCRAKAITICEHNEKQSPDSYVF